MEEKTDKLIELWNEFNSLVDKTLDYVYQFAEEGSYFDEHCINCPSMAIIENKRFCKKNDIWCSCISTLRCNFGLADTVTEEKNEI